MRYSHGNVQTIFKAIGFIRKLLKVVMLYELTECFSSILDTAVDMSLHLLGRLLACLNAIDVHAAQITVSISNAVFDACMPSFRSSRGRCHVSALGFPGNPSIDYFVSAEVMERQHRTALSDKDEPYSEQVRSKLSEGSQDCFAPNTYARE